jgi:hypothetical protein
MSIVPSEKLRKRKISSLRHDLTGRTHANRRTIRLGTDVLSIFVSGFGTMIVAVVAFILWWRVSRV